MAKRLSVRLEKDKPNPNAFVDDGWTVLMEAAHVGDYDIAKTLLNKDANPNAAKGYGWTALMDAAYCGNTPIVELLLNAGANRDTTLKAYRNALDAANLAWENAETQEKAKAYRGIVDMLKGKK